MKRRKLRMHSPAYGEQHKRKIKADRKVLLVRWERRVGKQATKAEEIDE